MRSKIIDWYLDVLILQQLTDLFICQVEVQGIRTIEIVVCRVVVVLLTKNQIQKFDSKVLAKMWKQLNDE